MEKSMTKQRIKQYSHLQREIIMLQGQILSAEIQGEEHLTDVVVGCSATIPYSKHSVVIKGYGSRAIPKLSARKAKYEAECDAIERFIEAVEDSVMRQLLTRRYIEGRTIKETAGLVGYTPKYISQKIVEFFENNTTNQD
jgi:hypothetical protein